MSFFSEDIVWKRWCFLVFGLACVGLGVIFGSQLTQFLTTHMLIIWALTLVCLAWMLFLWFTAPLKLDLPAEPEHWDKRHI